MRIQQGSLLPFYCAVFITLLTTGCQEKSYPLIDARCGTCHPAAVVYEQRYSAERWQRVIHGMELRGLVLDADERREILDLLSRHYSPSAR